LRLLFDLNPLREAIVPGSFNTAPRAQQAWSWLLAVWLFLGGTGSGLFLVFLAFGLDHEFAVLSLALVLTGGMVLLLELGNPLRAWRTVFRPGTSWLSRGVFFVLLFILSCVLSVGPTFEIFSSLSWLNNSLAEKLLRWVAGLSALMIILYPAFFFLSTSRAIPFWNTPLLPLLFLGYAALGGDGVFLLLSPRTTDTLARAELLAIILIVANAVMISLYLLAMEHNGGSARESVRLLSRSPLSWLSWIGVGVVGMVVPLLAMLFAQPTAAGAGILIGGLLFRFCLLKAGVYAASALAEEGRDLSRLNRTSADFEREYAGMMTQRTSRAG
jgi:formate-dependent nitrite reductase membrane component NrfD